VGKTKRTVIRSSEEATGRETAIRLSEHTGSIDLGGQKIKPKKKKISANTRCNEKRTALTPPPGRV